MICLPSPHQSMVVPKGRKNILFLICFSFAPPYVRRTLGAGNGEQQWRMPKEGSRMCSSLCSPHFQVKILTLMYLWAQSKPTEFAEITRNKLATIGIPVHRLSGKAGRFMKLKSEQVCLLGVRGGRGVGAAFWGSPACAESCAGSQDT